MKSLQVSILTVFLGLSFLMVHEAAEYFAYYDHGATHMDSGHIDFVHAKDNKTSDHPLLHVQKFALLPPDFIKRILSGPVWSSAHPQFALQGQLPSRASPVFTLNEVTA